MWKGSYYFSHDGNARNDEKVLMLRAEHGWEGYGLFWALVEMMFESKDTCLHHAHLKGIALCYNVDITVLEGVINTCLTHHLFDSDGVSFWSETLRQRKQIFMDARQQKSDAGKAGMAKRWGFSGASDNSVITEGNAVITEHNKVKVKEKDKVKNTTHSPPPIGGVVCAGDFEKFWQAYPKKVGKKAAEAAWKRCRPNKELQERILIAVVKAKVTEQWAKEGGRYIPNPATWLNQGRWEDEYEPAPRQAHVGRIKPESSPAGGKYDEIEAIRRRLERQKGGASG